MNKKEKQAPIRIRKAQKTDAATGYKAIARWAVRESQAYLRAARSAYACISRNNTARNRNKNFDSAMKGLKIAADVYFAVVSNKYASRN
jgi:hypothetical protein